MEESDWLRISQWNETKENIILVHGYAGGDDTLPNDVLRDGLYLDRSPILQKLTL
jgi:hypothetical protein